MKTKKFKIIITLVFIVVMITACTIPCFALFTLTGHYDPNGSTSTYYAYSSSECNRTINVSMYDLNGKFLKKVVLKTKYGQDNSFYIGLGGYDIVNFSSNQGLWETCKLAWTSGADLCTETELFINYYFRTSLSKKTIDVTVEMRKWEPIDIEVRHYIQTNPNYKIFTRDAYTLHSVTNKQTVDYYEYFSTSKKTITGYTLRSDYKSSISGKFCYDSLVGVYKNTPSSPRCHEYDLHLTGWDDDMEYWSTYKESKHGKIDWCNNRNFWVEYFYDLNEYTISYNANGGTGAPSSQTKYHGDKITLSDKIPTRSGFNFVGWGTSSTDTTTDYDPGATFTANTNQTLYAIWESNAPKTYTVSYNANGGIGAPSSQIKTHDVILKLSSTKPTRSGYTFKGWSTTSGAVQAVKYTAGSSYTDNVSITLYAVWQQNAPTTYTVKYNANGGGGAPTSQIKTHGIALTLSLTIPTRNGYDFLGWSTSSTATSATYDPGDNYTANASVTLYAVWEKSNYDFSISNLTVSNSETYKYDKITVKARADSWDQVNAYSDIPVQLYYDGRLVSTQYVDFSVYGVANITFTLNVGSSVGNKTIEARINWADHNSETRTGNNTVSTTINVQDYDYEVTMEPVSSAGYYCEGMEVISSFYVANNSDYDIVPSMHNTARFTAYYYNSSSKVVITTQDWDDVVIPAAGTNLVYFKWTVPAGLNGKTVYMECDINADRNMNEINYNNNTAAFSTTISKVTNSQTPDTRFESEAPNSYQSASTPSVSTDKATWTMWEYENGSFVLKKYCVQISSVSPVVAPSSDCVTAVYENGKWTMRSGYGITMSYAPTISTVSGYDRPDSNAYTSVQYVVATFPEFRYFDTNGNFRTLQYVNGSYQFVQNPDADGNARVHFIPVYVRDGNYTVSVTATHVWTPAGMIEATRSANVIIIDGTIYDDWYQG